MDDKPAEHDNPYVPQDGAHMTEEELTLLWENATAEDLYEAHQLWKLRLMAKSDQLQAMIDSHNDRCAHQFDPGVTGLDILALRANRDWVDVCGKTFVREKYLWHLAAGAEHERAAELAVQLHYWRAL